MPPESVHVPPFENEPEPSVESVTVPLGVEAPEPFVSVTVTVQFEVEPASTELGEQVTLVEVERAVMLNASRSRRVSEGCSSGERVAGPGLVDRQVGERGEPREAGCVVVPESVPLLGFVPIASETFVELSPVTRFVVLVEDLDARRGRDRLRRDRVRRLLHECEVRRRARE